MAGSCQCARRTSSSVSSLARRVGVMTDDTDAHSAHRSTALPGCRRCRWHWRKALQVGLRTGHSALQCRGRPLHWPALGTAVPANGPALGTHQCPVPAIERKRALECRPKVRQVPLFRSKKALNRARKPTKSDLMLKKARSDFSDNIRIHFSHNPLDFRRFLAVTAGHWLALGTAVPLKSENLPGTGPAVPLGVVELV